MSASYCKHHPSVPARWSCIPCRTDLCSRCTRTDYIPEPVAVCPSCGKELQPLSASNLITPFWRRIPRFFAFPFNPGSLGYIIVLAVLSVVLFRPTFMGLLLQVVPFLVFLRYAYSVLNRTALGHMAPPGIDSAMVGGDLGMPFKQFGVYICMGFITNLLSGLVGPVAAVAYFVVMLVCLPASAMMIAIENSFLRAINPVALLSVVTRIGWSYLILCIFLLILWGGTSVVMRLVLNDQHSVHTVLFVYNLASMYFLLVMFHMMGYVIYQYHEELAFDVDVDAEDQPEFRQTTGRAREPVNDHPVINEAEVMIKQGDISAAVDILKEGAARDREDLDVQDRLHKLLKMSGQTKSLTENAPAYIRNLLARNQTRKAADVFADVVQAEPSFRLSVPDQVLPIASELKHSGRPKAALVAMEGFANRFPGHDDIPETYFLAAKTFCEDLRQDGKARKILQQLLSRYPQHMLVPEIQGYLKTVDKLAS